MATSQLHGVAIGFAWVTFPNHPRYVQRKEARHDVRDALQATSPGASHGKETMSGDHRAGCNAGDSMPGDDENEDEEEEE